jgi:hypothetical protein
MSGAGLSTDQRLTEIVRRVRIISLTRFDFDGRAIEVPPPLPRQYPPIPMIERLQTELYAGAYCVRLDGGGFDDEAGENSDMYAALSASNASRTRVDPDWLVTEIDPARAVTVAKREAVRRIPPAEIFREAESGSPVPASAAQLGRLVPIMLPREYPEQGGFYFALGETVASTLEGRPAVRFYWNAPAATAPQLMAALTRTFNARSIPFAFKCPRQAAAYRRFDSAILFVGRPWVTATAAALAEIYPAVADRLRPDVPLFVRPLRPGFGFAEDPGNAESFGMMRSRLLAEALWTAFVEGRQGDDAAIAVIRRYFLQNGIDHTRPYLNPWSLDHYDLGTLA